MVTAARMFGDDDPRRQREVLKSVTDAILRHVGLDDLLRELVLRLRRTLEVDTVAILLRENGVLVARAAAGLEEEVEGGLRIAVGQGFAGRIAAAGQPALLEDVDHADVFNPLLREKRLKSMLGVPLLACGAVRGVLHVGSRRPRHFKSDETRLLQRAAEYAAPAIENARAREADRRRIESLEALNEVVTTLHAAVRIEQVMQAIANVAQRLSGGGQAFAGFFRGRGEPAPTEYHLWEVAGAPRAVFEHLDHLHITPLFAPTFEGRGTVRCDDIHTHPLFRGLPEGHIPVRSYLAVPVMLQSGQVLGAILLGHAEPGRFDSETQQHLESLARHAALALEKALLYERERTTADTLQHSHEAERAQRQAAERAAERIGRLQSVTAALSEAVTPEQVAEVIITHAVQSLGAAAGGLALLDKNRASLELVRATGYPAEVTQRWRRYPPTSYGGIADAMRTGHVVWHASLDHLDATYPEHEPLPEGLRRGGRAAVPLMLGDRAIGALYLNFRELRAFDADDLAFMLTLGRQCAQAVERARLYAREHQIAGTLQHALLPALPQVPGMLIDAVYRAATPEADVGGDWYDAFPLPDRRIALTVGDVAGHGLEAAVLMGEMRHAIRAAALAGHDPAKVLQVADTMLHTGGGAMATAVVVIVDPVKSEFTYAAAGHPPPIMATRKGLETLAQGKTIPLGFGEALPMAPESLPLPPDALLVLYTDGLIEVDHDPVSGEAALQAGVTAEYGGRFGKPAQAILDRVIAGRPTRDDIAILTVAVKSSIAR